MKQIGTTFSGSVIVEMTLDEFKALTETKPAPIKAPAVAKADPAKMNTAELVTFVKERIVKLKPKKRDGVIHSIAAMFQFNGGISEAQIQKIVTGLQRQGVLSISPDGKVAYLGS